MVDLGEIILVVCDHVLEDGLVAGVFGEALDQDVDRGSGVDEDLESQALDIRVLANGFLEGDFVLPAQNQDLIVAVLYDELPQPLVDRVARSLYVIEYPELGERVLLVDEVIVPQLEVLVSKGEHRMFSEIDVMPCPNFSPEYLH